MLKRAMNIADFDPELYQAIQDETQRQEHHIELIASENYCSPRVLEAQGSQLTNKYAEGYPHKRYYGGCEYVDIAEPETGAYNSSTAQMAFRGVQSSRLFSINKDVDRYSVCLAWH